MARRLVEMPSALGITDTSQPATDANLTSLQRVLGGLAAKKGQYGTAYDILKPPAEPVQKKIQDIQKKNSERIIRQMENYYFSNNLYKGFPYGLEEEVKARIDPNTAYSRYRRLLESLGPTLAKAAGDVGNIALQEQIVQRRLFPGALMSRSSAEDMFSQARIRFGLPERSYKGM